MKDIIIKGARQGNLKNISLTIPRNKLVVFTGVSGSGKSTLAFDTIFAEGQRKFVESLSSYARQFLGQIEKPDVDSIEGLSPCISIDQKTTNQNPRSTVGTITEIYDYLRLLFANVGSPHCPNCGIEITNLTIDEITEKVQELGDGEKIIILSPAVQAQKGSFKKLFENLKKSGYQRVEVDNIIYDLDEEITLDKNIKHNINVVVDRIIIKKDNFSRLNSSIEAAIKLSGANVIILHNEERLSFSNSFACKQCGFSFSEISPRMFSFNNPYGACPECSGLGVKREISEQLVMGDTSKSLREGALCITGWNFDTASYTQSYFKALSERYGFSLDTPIKDMPRDILDIILYGNNGEILDVDYNSYSFSGKVSKSYEGVIPNLQRRFQTTTSDYVKQEIGKYMTEINCPVCNGKRLKPEILSIKINGKNIDDLCSMSVGKLHDFLDDLKLSKTKNIIAEPILKEAKARLNFLKNVGLDYLSLSRSSGTLSGGESQRIRLATQIGSGLVGVLYVLDEPSIGLHQRDNERLISTLKNLRDLGNTLIVVEHDDDTVNSADYVVDIGPKAGIHGGEIVVAGTVDDVKNNSNSLTGKYLSGERFIPIPAVRRTGDKGYLEITGAKENNLKNIDVKIPLGLLTCITGVSGSGKSSLINGVLLPALNAKLNNFKTTKNNYESFTGYENCDKVIAIDQSPIGRTPRSNPATYTGLFTLIRELFATTKDAKEKGYKAGRFSFNVSGGRCEACSGDGIKKIEMYFLPDVYVPCEVCKGMRYNKETLEVKYKGKNIYDVLDMTVDEALYFFESHNNIVNKIQTLKDVGLGYIKLGQSATTLSGGEAQRVKLATELSKRSTRKTVYILDEPTTGLHNYDVDKLIKILQRLVQENNTCIVIEHNLDVIKVADHIVDLGPEGGDNGGQVVACGTPEEIIKVENSWTGKFLKRLLKK